MKCVHRHPLNLIEHAAAEHYMLFWLFLYLYFTGSTNRYKVLAECLKTSETSKPIFMSNKATTRWSFRVDGIKALLGDYKEIKMHLLMHLGFRKY